MYHWDGHMTPVPRRWTSPPRGETLNGVDLASPPQRETLNGVDLTSPPQGETLNGADLTSPPQGETLNGAVLSSPPQGGNPEKSLITRQRAHEGGGSGTMSQTDQSP